MYVIEKNITLPAARGGRSDPNSFFGTLRRLQVGDSVIVRRRQQSTSVACAKARKETGYRYATRRVGEGTRVWRVA